MPLTVFEKSALAVSGLSAFAVGAAILFSPHSFFASYGIALGDDASLLSELRAPAAGLATFGLLMLAGIRHAAFAPVSKAAALTVFLGFPAGRLVGLMVDGMPSGGIIGALAFELIVAALCVVAFGRLDARVRTQISTARSGH